MEFPGRKERRALAKKLGFKSKNEPTQEWIERIQRSQDIGKQIHLMNIQELANKEIARKNELLEASKITDTSGNNSTNLADQENNEDPQSI